MGIAEFFNPHRPDDAPPTTPEWLAANPDVASLINALDAEASAGRAQQAAMVNSQIRVSEDTSAARLNLARLEAQYAKRGLPIPPEVRAEHDGKIVALESAEATHQTRTTEMTRVFTAPRDLSKAATRYISQKLLPLGKVKRIEVKLPKGRLEDIVTTSRRERLGHIAERGAVLDRRLPMAMAIERAVALVPIVESPFQVSFDAKQRAHLYWATESVHAEPITIGGGTPQVTDAAAVAAWLARDQMIAEVERQVTAMYAGNPPTATAAEKRGLVAKIDADILAAERIEAVACWESRKNGDAGIPWRGDLDVRALLGIEGPAPERLDD